jgi:predicted RNase H-like nuclease
MQQEQLKQTDTLAAALNISQAEAKALQAKLIEAQNKPPVVSYHVTERTVEKAAEQVKKDIDAGKSPANKIPADKTIVTPNTDQQKVDVYRITMDKPRAVGAYVSTESAGIMAQYKGTPYSAAPGITAGMRLASGT